MMKHTIESHTKQVAPGEGTSKRQRTQESFHKSEVPTKIKQYACLGCFGLFSKWGDARNHMTNCQYYVSSTKPNIKVSRTLATAIMDSNPSMKATVLTEAARQPWFNVPEQELIETVKAYYEKIYWNRNKMKNVMSHAIRPKYGEFPFAKFGYGNFKTWSQKHGLNPCE